MSPQTRIFLVRHGQTRWNQEHRLQGQKNSPLTPLGREQALAAQKTLVPYRLHRAYVSPLGRARQTLEIILGARKIPVIESEGLKEINLGPWEGKTRQETRISNPDEYEMFWEQPDRFHLEGAEDFQRLQQRMVRELETIFDREQGRDILVVSHWIAIKTALAHYTSTPLGQLPQLADPGNGALLILVRHKNQVSVQGLPNG